MGHHRRNYTDEYKAAAVERLYEPGATQGSVAREPGITGTQLKTWRLEIEAFGSAEAKRRQKADAAEPARLRKENRRLTEEVEILHKGHPRSPGFALPGGRGRDAGCDGVPT